MTAPRRRRATVLAAVLVPVIIVLGACGSSAEVQAPSVAAATIPSTDPLCDRFVGIYGAWRGAWLRDIEARTEAGVTLADAQKRGEIALTTPFRRAVTAEIARDGLDAVDPNLQAAMAAVTSSPQSPDGYHRLATVCGATGPFTQ